MLVTFKTKSYANITMFGEIARRFLELMDFGCNVPGGIVAADVPTALSNLERGLKAVPAEENNGDEDDDQPSVSIHTRALPLVELLQAAKADDNDVRWE